MLTSLNLINRLSMHGKCMLLNLTKKIQLKLSIITKKIIFLSDAVWFLGKVRGFYLKQKLELAPSLDLGVLGRFALRSHLKRVLFAACLWADVTNAGVLEYNSNGERIERLTVQGTVTNVNSKRRTLLQLAAENNAVEAAKHNAVKKSKLSTNLKLVKYTKDKHVPIATSIVASWIHDAAFKYAKHPILKRVGISPVQWAMIFRANIEIESAYKVTARSNVGAIGLGQLMPQTAQVLGVNPFDPKQNLDGSARYLLEQIGKFNSIKLGLAAYNAGPAAVEKYGGIPPFKETQGHVRKVMSVYLRLMRA